MSATSAIDEAHDGQPSASGKAKQTRRRQRLSCVECTRRRQKCDRQIPCGLCVSRGVPQLCRWEPLVARPAPQRPPEGAPTVPESAQSTIAALSARIAALEDVISRQNVQIQGTVGKGLFDTASGAEGSSSSVTVEALVASGAVAAATSPSDSTSSDRSSSATGGKNSGKNGSSTSPSSHGCSPNGSAIEEEEGSLSHYDYDVQRAAVALAQLSLAPQDEYIGMGTIPYALNKLGDPYRAKWTYARSANTTTVSEPFQPGNHPLSGPIQQLVASLPLRHVVDTLVDGYFAERNWQFGIPEQWFRRCCEQMWRHLHLRCPGPSCHLSGGCTRCTEELNPHWLSLMFAVLALAPQRIVGNSAKTYFLKAMEARRLVEDILLASRAYSQPSAVQGVVLSCIGAALLARYLADRGRVSDAWKLTGTALRNAQAVGLHRDPGWQKWETMDKQERELRVLGWWFLVIADRLYSFTLGRPMMSTEGSFDVKMVPDDVHGDGSPNPVALFHKHFIGLCEIMGEMIEKCLGVAMPAYATVLEIDRKFKFWLCRLHPSLDWREPHEISNPITFEERTRAYQRHMCAGYYLCATMILHRPYLMHAPPILPPPKPLSATMTVIMNPSRERCIELAMELVRVMCDAQEEAATWEPDPQLPAMMYHYAYFVFDGAIALVGAFSQEPPHPKAQECLALIDRAMRMLHWCVEATKNAGGRDGEGETAVRAITVLNALRKAGRWDERFRKGETRKQEDGSPGSQGSPQEPPVEAPQDGMFSYGQAISLNLEAARYATTSYGVPENSNIPFLNTPASGVSFPFLNPVQVQSSATMPMPFGDGRDFTASVPVGMSGVDSSGGAGASASRGTTGMQTMVMPFDMLQGGESYDVDWSAFAEIQGWPANGLFGDSYQ
ncbi:hypothetical protein PYCCODRAFT_1453475 [Trametes coccinea BRFM310]|uniref:Zn(2)-C6 fungal-type domain-containing protein n=1 Tax=Trametes coccinea (strain BRFM310) TaxID=1353009 RepID=A0A1Y2IFX0_TRAC3|nr:hypothetical protein PYCCODRAFT_1453475 [Trametes coccinea BRFM310]